MQVEIITAFGKNNFEMNDDKAFELLKYAHDNRKQEEPELEEKKHGHVYAGWRQDGQMITNGDEYSFVYKGFMYVKCSACGATKGFNAKIGRSEFKCDECGNTTKLMKMRPLHLNCRCGASFTYRTNLEDQKFIMECINCHGSVELVENASKSCYITAVDRSEDAEQKYFASQMARLSV